MVGQLCVRGAWVAGLLCYETSCHVIVKIQRWTCGHLMLLLCSYIPTGLGGKQQERGRGNLTALEIELFGTSCWGILRKGKDYPLILGLPWWLSQESACKAGNLGLIPGSGRSPEEGNGSPLQYSCLEKPTGRWAWQAEVHGDEKSRTWLSDFTSLSLLLNYLFISYHNIFESLEKEEIRGKRRTKRTYTRVSNSCRFVSTAMKQIENEASLKLLVTYLPHQ